MWNAQNPDMLLQMPEGKGGNFDPLQESVEREEQLLPAGAKHLHGSPGLPSFPKAGMDRNGGCCPANPRKGVGFWFRGLKPFNDLNGWGLKGSLCGSGETLNQIRFLRRVRSTPIFINPGFESNGLPKAEHRCKKFEKHALYMVL